VVSIILPPTNPNPPVANKLAPPVKGAAHTPAIVPNNAQFGFLVMVI